MTDIHQDGQAPAHIERGRRSARRTAWLLAGIAVLVYAGFLMLGAMGT